MTESQSGSSRQRKRPDWLETYNPPAKHRRSGKHQRGRMGKAKLFYRTLFVTLVWGTALLVLLGLLGTTRHYQGPSLGGLHSVYTSQDHQHLPQQV